MAFSTFGFRDIHGTLGSENTEVVREYYVDTWLDLTTLLQILTGASDGNGGSLGQAPPGGIFNIHELPQAYDMLTGSGDVPFQDMYCADVTFGPIKEGAVQGSLSGTYSPTQLLAFINSLENVVGGFKVVATYRPMTDDQVIDEAWDFSGQVMSLISNAWAQDPTYAMKWEDGTNASNLKGMTKIIPKVELLQKLVFRTEVPSDDAVNLIGSVNDAPFTIMQQDQTSKRVWEPETLLLIALPTIRRWRWDGLPQFETTIRIAANIYQDKLLDGTTDYVTWNRLYNIYATGGPVWERLYLPGTDSTPMYRTANWDVLYAL